MIHVSEETTRVAGNLPAALDQLGERGTDITREPVSRKYAG